ncbi:hypothetical protein ACJMK2_022273 [Sinanodonta woodiana]|uniref:Dual oxidase maturation factor 1 n=1 Tax=Sinanodonta woodiana TaxID=1069815 RepID=A0ABD3TJA3_SINWO
MAWFKAFRNEFGYAYYSEQRLPVMLDVPLTVVIYVCLCISIAFLIAAAGIQGKERWYALIRLVYSLLIGSVILVSIFGHSWQVAYNDIKAPYIYRSDSYIDGKIGIRIGLYTVNITLTGYFEGNQVDYNEEILLEDINGPATELHHALDRGLPHPILMVLEHFDIDEGGLRFGRSCKIAGHFAGILLWTAFAFWIASNIILCSVVCYGTVCFTASGVCMVLAIVVYNHLNLSLGFRLPGSQGGMQLHYGWCLLSTLILGIITTLFGILLILADYKYPKKVAALFSLETALESHHEDYTYRYPIPAVDNNKTGTYYAPPNNEKGHPMTLNRYLNNRFECSPNKKKSPFLGGSDSDISTIHESDGAF